MILYYPFVNLPDSVFIYLYHLAVVGHKSVNFNLDIRCLRIHSTYKPFLGKMVKIVCVADIAVSQLRRGLAVDIAELTVRCPDMTVDHHSYASVFAEHVRSFRVIDMCHGR